MNHRDKTSGRLPALLIGILCCISAGDSYACKSNIDCRLGSRCEIPADAFSGQCVGGLLPGGTAPPLRSATDNSESSCNSDSDCPLDALCAKGRSLGGVCIKTGCSYDSDCDVGEICTDVPTTDGFGEPEVLERGLGEAVFNGVCAVDSCVFDFDCGDGFVCRVRGSDEETAFENGVCRLQRI